MCAYTHTQNEGSNMIAKNPRPTGLYSGFQYSLNYCVRSLLKKRKEWAGEKAGVLLLQRTEFQLCPSAQWLTAICSSRGSDSSWPAHTRVKNSKCMRGRREVKRWTGKVAAVMNTGCFCTGLGCGSQLPVDSSFGGHSALSALLGIQLVH